MFLLVIEKRLVAQLGFAIAECTSLKPAPSNVTCTLFALLCNLRLALIPGQSKAKSVQVTVDGASFELMRSAMADPSCTTVLFSITSRNKKILADLSHSISTISSKPKYIWYLLINPNWLHFQANYYSHNLHKMTDFLQKKLSRSSKY